MFYPAYINSIIQELSLPVVSSSALSEVALGGLRPPAPKGRLLEGGLANGALKIHNLAYSDINNQIDS